MLDERGRGQIVKDGRGLRVGIGRVREDEGIGAAQAAGSAFGGDAVHFGLRLEAG